MSDTTSSVDAAWTSYAERLKAAGESIVGEGFPTDARLRAEGYRYMGRLANTAHQIYLEFGDKDRPTLFRFGDDITPFGATNTDNNYCRAMVDPAGTYLITGNVSGVQEMLVSVHDGEMVLGKTAVLSEVSLGDLDIDADGSLELVVGGPERATNWMPLTSEAVYVNIRQFIKDWENDPIASLTIQRVDDVPLIGNVSPDSIAAALEQAATWVEASVSYWNQYSAGITTFTPQNEFLPPRRPEGAAINMVLGAARWVLAPDEALIVEFDQPNGTYWSIQNYMFSWLQPLDFANRTTSLNDAQAHIDADGKVRLVICHEDPGVPNWLDTSGLREGLVSYRWVRATEQPTPAAFLVPLDQVRKHLPDSTPEVTPSQRAEQIAARRRGISRRFRR